MAAKKTSKEDLMFQVDQLRQDRVVSTLESLALSFLSFLFYVTAPAVMPKVFGPLGDPDLQVKILIAIFGVPALYWVYSTFGNLVRVRKIKVLESEL